MSKQDLGTYWLRVELKDGRGWLQEWKTGGRYTNQCGEICPLNASRIGPNWESEEELIETAVYMYRWGNYECDCNKTLFLCEATQQDAPEDLPCGDTMPLAKLTLIRPDASELVIWENGKELL